MGTFNFPVIPTVKRYCRCGLIACLITAGLAIGSQDSLIMQAMRDELSRSLQKLQMETLEKPYFISYRIDIQNNCEFSGTFGGIVTDNQYRFRSLTVELRVGDSTFDNTNFYNQSGQPSGQVRMWGSSATVPIDTSYTEIRRQLWLVTDVVYKRALETLARKRAYFKNRRSVEQIPDFLGAKAVTVYDTAFIRPAMDTASAKTLVRELSSLFKKQPALFTSTVNLAQYNMRAYYINSETGAYVKARSAANLTAIAATQAADGLPLEDFVEFHGRDLRDLPSKEKTIEAIRTMAGHLAALQNSPMPDLYNGPVLFVDQAAAEIFAQVMLPRLVAVRLPIIDDPRYAVMPENSFLDKRGSRVLPEFLSVVDNPTLSQFNTFPLLGNYAVDMEGVPGRPTTLIDKGYLKGLLASRNPARGITASTGNRRGSSPLPSNVIVSTDQAKSLQELKSRMLEIVKKRSLPYGMIVYRIGDPYMKVMLSRKTVSPFADASRIEGIIWSCRLYADGHEEQVRNAEISGMTEEAFKNILAVGSEALPYTFVMSLRSISSFAADLAGDNSPADVSIVTPSLLFEDVTIKKPSGEIPALPVARHPFFSK